ncbi:hypothetical protein AB4Z21_17675 [Paenibacillus sp. MCAF20]
MKLRRSGFLLMVVSLILTVILAGCRSNGPAPSETGESPQVSEEGQLNPVTLKIMFPGDPPADWDEVKAEMENRLAGTLNVKLNVVYIPWTDVLQKRQVALSSAEDYDLIWDNNPVPQGHSGAAQCRTDQKL